MNYKYQTLRVFINDNGDYGNPVGIIVDLENKLTKEERQTLSTTIGFSESVFINQLDPVKVSIFNPQREVPFAGHAMVGAAWFIRKNYDLKSNFIDCLGGRIKTWQDDGLTWIQAKLSSMPPWQYEQLESPKEVENYPTNKAKSKEHAFVWSWLDKDKRIVRARTFAPDWGIPEDEANGSGSMKLSSDLKLGIKIIHGKGSVIYANPLNTEFVEVGGMVKEDKTL